MISAPDLQSEATGFNSRQRQTTLHARGSPSLSPSRGRHIGTSFDWGKVAALRIVYICTLWTLPIYYFIRWIAIILGLFLTMMRCLRNDIAPQVQTLIGMLNLFSKEWDNNFRMNAFCINLPDSHLRLAFAKKGSEILFPLLFFGRKCK
jgi:hypothetical protein